MIKNKNIKHILSTSVLSVLGLLPITHKAAAQQKPAYENENCKETIETPYYCKFINDDTQLVVNYKDTFFVYGIYITLKTGQKQFICDLGPNMPNLICNIDYYKNTPWIPPVQTIDTLTQQAISKDIDLVNKYYAYQNKGDYAKRDSVELLLLANRKQLIESQRQNQK